MTGTTRRSGATDAIIRGTCCIVLCSLFAWGSELFAAEPMHTDDQARVKRARQFAIDSPENLGQRAIEIIQEGLTDPNPDVLMNYIGALQRMGRAYGLFSTTPPPAGAPARPEVPTALTSRVRELVEHENKELANQSAVALALISEHDRELEEFFLSTILRNDRLTQSGSAVIGLLGLQGIKTQEMTAWLLQTVQDGSSYSNAESAALALGQMDPPPPELLPDLVTLLRDKRDFANFNLLKLIQRYGDAAKPYLQQLREIKVKLDEGVPSYPPESSADRETVKLLNQVIDELERKNKVNR